MAPPIQKLPQQEPTTTAAAVKQYGFHFDAGRCFACQDCMEACMEWNGLPTGPGGRWMRVFHWETGAWPDVRTWSVGAPCYHCENPVCVDAANGALYKEPKYGAVLLDPEKAKTHLSDLRKANEVCPYGAIMFSSDGADAVASKCTMCIDRLEQGLAPICVLVCADRAWEFGPLDELIAKFGNNRQLKAPDGAWSMPDPAIASPAIVFKEQMPRKDWVPYDRTRARDLWQKRTPAGSHHHDARPNAPPVYANRADANDDHKALVQHNKLKWHFASSEELLWATSVDE